MAASLGLLLFAYICLVFQVTHRICMMQCNPMPGPGMYHGDMGDIRFSGSHVENTGSVRERRDGLNTRQIRFEPSYLDFQEQPVGMPRIKTVAIINPNTEQSLQLQSISGSTVHFHASFFQAKIVQPLGNTTFEIVFLARLVGNAENTLFIHTSKGVYPYQVFGSGSANPYRLRPFLGARIPLNFSFTSLINMHNPYNSPLQVVEMYSSGGDLHLELPSGLEKAPQKHWEIPAYETKALMRVSFVGRSVSNHTAFIRIKTSNPSPVTEFLILPVEVEVTSVPGLFASVDLLDFGTLRTMDEPKAVGVYLLNSGTKQVHISSITVEPSNSAVSVTFTPLILKHGSKYVKVATVTYSAYHAKRNKQTSGKIIIKTTSKTSSRLELPYQANVLLGTIAYSVSKTRFFVGQSPFEPVIRELPITNTFSFTMVIYEAVFPQEVENLFQVVNFTKPAMIPPQMTATPFYVHFVANSSDLAFSTILRVYTNASIFTIPIHCYNGRVQYIVEGLEEDIVDYGTVGTGENRTKLLKIYNSNPIEVTISKITCNIEFAAIKLLDVRPNDVKNVTAASSKSKTESEHGKVSVKPDHAAVFSVDVAVPKKEGSYNGKFEITTDFEVLHIPIYFKAMDGKVFPSPKLISFQPCFPGRIERSSLLLTSTFLHPLKLLSVTPEPANPQFSFEVNNKTELAETNGIMGNVLFDPLQSCKGQCYVGLGSGNLASKWLNTLTLPPDVVDVDSQHVDKLQRVFDSLKRTGKNRLNTTLVIDTDLAQGIRVVVQATLSWPSLAPDKPIKFPLTHIGNKSIKYFSLENPADLPVVVQIVSLFSYPKPQGLLDVVADRFGADLFDLEQIDNVFSLPNTDDEKQNSTNGSLLGVTPAIQGVLGVAPASSTYVAILQPRSKIQIPVQFSPVDDRTRSSIILVRNNLTVVDAVNVQGQGARGEFMLNSKQPGIHSTLLFELRASHLSDCHKPSRSRSQPPLSVKKVLTATNPGQLAIFVSSLSINGRECEGWGFKILNCKSFILNPNSSRKIEIAFTPDFTMSRVTRQLEIKTTFGPVMEFTLVATIPSHILPLCATAMGRSSWEPVLQVLTVVVMVSMFIAVVVAAYSEARSIFGISVPTTNLLLNCEERGQVFDLKAIAGVKPKTTKEERQINVRKSRRDIKDTKTNDRQIGDSTTTSAPPSTSPNPINNNVNKSSPSTRQDSGSTKNRSPKPSSSSNRLYDSIDGSRRSNSSPHEPKLRPEKPARNNTDWNKRPIDLNRDYRPAVVEIEELKQSIACVQEMESENSLNFVKDFKDVKSRSKKKSKALNKREEMKSKSKDKSNSRQPDSYEAGCSDESGNETYPDKITLDLRMDGPTDNKSLQRASESNQQTSNKATNDKTKTRKNQVAPSTSDSKAKKHDNQTSKSKPDSTTKNKDRAAALLAEPRDLGPNSPHAIAAAVMSHLEKSLQTSTRDNSYDEGEPKRKAFNKVPNRLSDSPPLISPTNLSGSSRSSSYSSIVSDGSSSGSDQGKGSLTKALKQRLKPSRSMPMGDQSAVYDPADHQGFRASMKHSPYSFNLSSAKKSPWSTSADSALAPGSPSPTIQRSSVPQFSSIPSSSLFESTPFNSSMSTTKPDDPRSSPSTDGPRTLDLSAFGVSGAMGDSRSRPSIWSSPQNDDRFENSHSLFSVPPPQGDESFQGKHVRRPNNWVNFLDNANTSPTAVNFKSVAEIWDSGSTPAIDGWSHCSPSSYPADSRESEADPVDALFSTAADWSTAVDSQDNTTFVAQETWGPAPVSSIWGEQYSIPTSGTTATSNTLTFQSLSPQPGVDSPEPESPGGTFDTMNGFSPADIWQQQQQPWSSSKE